MRKFVSMLLWCQDCGAQVPGPQTRDWKPGDTVTIIRGRKLDWQWASYVIRDNAPAIILGVNADGQYLVQVGAVSVIARHTCLVEIAVWPGETAEVPIRLGGNDRRAAHQSSDSPRIGREKRRRSS